MSGESLFASQSVPETGAQPASHRGEPPPWVVLIVDDEPAVLETTGLVVAGFRCDGRAIRMPRAYTAAETRSILGARDGVGLAPPDVVMESDQAGLDLARYIREQPGNGYTRIVLRTGQPGAAPEEQVIRDYDINEYRDKTGLTKTRLTTLFCSALRSCRDICTIRASVKGMDRAIGVINQVSESRSNSLKRSEPEAFLDDTTRIAGLLLANLNRTAELVRGFQQVAVHQSTGRLD